MNPKITTTTERRRGFQPPWYTVQHVDCPEHGRTTWRPNGAIGLRRTPSGGLVPIRETFPGYCPGCQDAARAGHQYSVTVGNIGTVYDGPSLQDARETTQTYIEQSKSGYGRAAGEPVTLWQDGEPFDEYPGKGARP